MLTSSRQTKERSLPGNTGGFSLIEIVVTLALIAVLTSLVFPQISTFLADEQKPLRIMSEYITRARGDAFLHDAPNVLLITSDNVSGLEMEDENLKKLLGNDFTIERNSLWLMTLHGDGELKPHVNKNLRHLSFPGNGQITGITPQASGIKRSIYMTTMDIEGSTSPFIVYLESSGKEYSLIVSGHAQDPEILEGYITWEEYLNR